MTPVRSRRAIKMAALKRETLIGQVRQRFKLLVAARCWQVRDCHNAVFPPSGRKQPPAAERLHGPAGQALMLYTALVSASTPVALRYLYLTPHPPASAVLASIQLAFAAAILGIITGWLLGVISLVMLVFQPDHKEAGRNAAIEAPWFVKSA